ncbi:Predicted aminopeptidase [Ekhidna lutea]|uniref:Predicted aminopeptidase n=1 Tax=Ekhidna lutea TaxID=447679 RepID=A0A239IZP3_EKHLU|nr:aminopeptidase [Ekhidna lutea]SNS98995.1 Predicted aminopeptidase [Ekhidna lutea]
MIKKVSGGILMLMIVLLIIYWELIAYGFKQAKGQLRITLNTVPIEQVLADSMAADSIKIKIQIVNDVRTFAFGELGLKKSANYTTYYNQKGEVLLWNLSASKAYALEPKMWSFPLLGSFPYKGFFDLENAKSEMNELKTKGYDTRIRPVGGWSTLGWTKDPILSNMLERPEGSLVELIIHELTHSTLFVKDNVEFNENLASFIGEKGAIQFLNKKYGKNSESYFEYVMAEDDSRTFRNQMLDAAQILDSLYQTLENESDSVKAIQKHILIDLIVNSIDTLHFHNPRYYKAFDEARPNNAYFMSFLRYYSAKDSLEEMLINNYENDLKRFIKGMKAYHE